MKKKISAPNRVFIKGIKLNKFKAFNEWPGISFIYKEKLIKIHEIFEKETNSLAQPGEIISFNKDGLSIKTKDSSIVITHLQFQNKNIISSKDAFNSYRNFFQ